MTQTKAIQTDDPKLLCAVATAIAEAVGQDVNTVRILRFCKEKETKCGKYQMGDDEQ